LQTSIEFKRFNDMPSQTIFYDGVCNLCNQSVQFVLQRDESAQFKFASLQSEYAKKHLGAFGKFSGAPSSVVLVTDSGQVYTESSAAIRIAMRLGGLWPLMRVFLLVPAFVRDAVYRFVARNRYRWFGKSESCMLPNPKWKERFLDV
jgi:predicted DCC family thiol-disulfide oxidoreductase YuxK